MNNKDLQHITNLREDLYQAMLIGSIKLNNKSVEDLYNFMNYQDKEIERLKNDNERISKQHIYTLDKLIEAQTKIENAIEYIKHSIENGEYFEDDLSSDIAPASYDKYVNSNDLLEILDGDENE